MQINDKIAAIAPSITLGITSKAKEIAGNNAFREMGLVAQAKSAVLLKNDQLLPLKKGTKIYAEGMINSEVLNTYGELVNDPLEADVILKRIKTPYEERDEYFLEPFFHQGRLFYSDEENAESIIRKFDDSKQCYTSKLCTQREEVIVFSIVLYLPKTLNATY